MVKASLLATTMLIAPQIVHADVSTLIAGNNGTLPLPTGEFVTPVAPLTSAVQQFLNPHLAAYPNFVAGEAVKAQLSPDGTMLAILTAGQNTQNGANGQADPAGSTQYIFLYNVAGANKTNPMLAQVIQQTNAHAGLAWAPDGSALYAAGGNDDAVYKYTSTGGTWSLSKTIPLGHVPAGTHANGGIGLNVQPNASGLAVSPDGKTVVVANNYNDSISVIDTASGTVRYEHDLRPYFVNNEGTSGVAGGEYPFAVAMKGNIAYVSSVRDRQIVVVDVSSPTAGKLVTRIALNGNPYGITFNASQSTLYVAQDNSDQVAVIDTASNKVTANIDTRAPAGVLSIAQTGAAPINVTVSPDGNTLYAVNNGANSIAVIPLTGANAMTVTGLIPTAYAPKDITFSADGSWMYIINGLSDTGPNPLNLTSNTAYMQRNLYVGGDAAASVKAKAGNEYQFQLEHATLVSAKVPAAADLPALTSQVVQNNQYNHTPSATETATMSFLNQHIKHIILVGKENRTFDQLLGDLRNGSNGDPSLTQFGVRVTPNYHRIASNFVTLDNFMDPADGSMEGWSWLSRGRITNTLEITQEINYAGVNRGLSYESEGGNRNTPVGLSAIADRDAASNGLFSKISSLLKGGTANLFPGPADVTATDAPWGQQQGYIFDAVLKAGLTVRNYGWLNNNIGPTTDSNGNPITNAGAAGVVQIAPLNARLAPYTDVYYRGFDQTFSDQWLYNEWKREFDQYVANGNLPSLTLLRLNHDHMGSFGTALAGVNTPEKQQADNDLAMGKVLAAVAHSPYAKDTLFIIMEDDCQDGPDHVDSHRATAYVVGPYVKQHTVVSTRYSQVNALRTVEDILGLQHINLLTASQSPMTDVFDITRSPFWTYNPVASTILSTTQLSLADIGVQFAEGPVLHSQHDSAYWAKATRGFDFSAEDRVPPRLFNEVIWQGTMNGTAYPGPRSAKSGPIND